MLLSNEEKLTIATRRCGAVLDKLRALDSNTGPTTSQGVKHHPNSHGLWEAVDHFEAALAEVIGDRPVKPS